MAEQTKRSSKKSSSAPIKPKRTESTVLDLTDLAPKPSKPVDLKRKKVTFEEPLPSSKKQKKTSASSQSSADDCVAEQFKAMEAADKAIQFLVGKLGYPESYLQARKGKDSQKWYISFGTRFLCHLDKILEVAPFRGFINKSELALLQRFGWGIHDCEEVVKRVSNSPKNKGKEYLLWLMPGTGCDVFIGFSNAASAWGNGAFTTTFSSDEMLSDNYEAAEKAIKALPEKLRYQVFIGKETSRSKHAGEIFHSAGKVPSEHLSVDKRYFGKPTFTPLTCGSLGGCGTTGAPLTCGILDVSTEQESSLESEDEEKTIECEENSF